MTVQLDEQRSTATPTPEEHRRKNLLVRDLFVGVTEVCARLAVMTDGVLDCENPSVKGFDNWDEFYKAVNEIVDESGDRLIHDRRGLAGLMGSVMDRLQEWNPRYNWREFASDYRKQTQPLYPIAFASVKKVMMQGGAITFQPHRVFVSPTEHHGAKYSCFKFAADHIGIDLRPFETVLDLANDEEKFWGYSDGWHYIHANVPQPLPAKLIELRDFMFDNDATPGKEAKAPW